MHNSALRGSIFWAAFIVSLLATVPLHAQGEPRVKRVSSARLVFHGSPELAYLKTGEKVSAEPFEGIAFTEGDGWRAECTYSNGVLEGPVTVINRNKLLYSFEYKNGKKVLKK